MVVIQLFNNNEMKQWDGFAVFCYMISCAVVLKNTLIIFAFLIQRCMARDAKDVQMRPPSYGML